MRAAAHWLCGWLALLGGCAMSAPIHVLHPSRLGVSKVNCVAFAPISAKGSLSGEMEKALVANHPPAASELQVLTTEALANASPIRLASTAPLTSDLTAIHAARQAQADLLLIGEVIQDDLIDPRSSTNESNQWNVYGSKGSLVVPPSTVQRPQRIALAWRVFDVSTGEMIGSHTLAIDRIAADQKYPELQLAIPEERARVIAAGARETWQAITPYVEQEKVVLALPWLQPGAAQIRRGNGYARQGRWDMAEVEWTAANTRYPFSNSAKHNLAIAHVAKEDFSEAKQTLGRMGPWRLRNLQSETLVWIDQRHRWYHEAMGLESPEEGWAFPEPLPALEKTAVATTAPDPADQPLWTVIPFTKPPGWRWRQWLFQPWAL